MDTLFFSRDNIAALKSISTEFAVRVLLTECLQVHGVSPFSAFLNARDPLTDDVVSSELLYDEALKYVRSDELPTYLQFNHEVFSRRYSFDPTDRVIGLDRLAFEKIVTRIILALNEVDSVRPSERSIRPLGLEDVRLALKTECRQ